MMHIARLSLALVGAALSLQGGAAFGRAHVDAVVDLKQITIQLPPGETPAQQAVRVKAFREATSRIRSCADVERLARLLRGAVVFRPQVPLSALPAPVRALLTAAGPGRATIPFGDPPAVRVLVQCGPAREAPIRKQPVT